MHTTLRAERSETDSTKCCPQGGEAINVEGRGAALCAIAHDHEVRSRRCTAAGAATPRGSTISCGHRPAAGHGYAKAGTPVQIRLTAPFQTPPWPTQQGTCLVNRIMWARNPPEDPFQHSLHSVTAAFFVVNEAAPGQNRLREPFQSCAGRSRRASGLQVHATRCESGAHVHFSSDTREPAALACLGSKSSPGQHRGIRPLSNWSVA